MTSFGVVLILLLWFILFRKKIKKGIPLSKKEIIIELILSISTLGLLILGALAYFQISPSALTSYLSKNAYDVSIILILFIVSVIVVVVVHRRKGIRQWMERLYIRKLERKIRIELEKESTNKNLTFPYQSRDYVLSILASRLSRDIVEKTTPKKYIAQPMKDRDDVFYIDKDTFRIPLQSVESLAEKMTKLSEDPKYRKKWRMALLP